MSKGRIIYVPESFIEEMENIRIEDEIDSAVEAIRKMVKNSRRGREQRRRGLW